MRWYGEWLVEASILWLKLWSLPVHWKLELSQDLNACFEIVVCTNSLLILVLSLIHIHLLSSPSLLCCSQKWERNIAAIFCYMEVLPHENVLHQKLCKRVKFSCNSLFSSANSLDGSINLYNINLSKREIQDSWDGGSYLDLSIWFTPHFSSMVCLFGGYSACI